MDEVVAVLHFVNSGDFVTNGVVVEFHSVNSGGFRDGLSRGGVPCR